MIFASGALCFFLEKEWFQSISAKTKIPIYALLGSSISFTMHYLTVDALEEIKIFVEYACCCFLSERKRSNSGNKKSKSLPLLITHV